ITETYASAPIIYGAILGAMMGFDLGGPVNKTALLVSSAIFIDTMNQFGPEGVNAIPQAATGAAISVAPLGAAIATWLFRKHFSWRNGPSALRPSSWEWSVSRKERFRLPPPIRH